MLLLLLLMQLLLLLMQLFTNPHTNTCTTLPVGPEDRGHRVFHRGFDVDFRRRVGRRGEMARGRRFHQVRLLLTY